MRFSNAGGRRLSRLIYISSRRTQTNTVFIYENLRKIELFRCDERILLFFSFFFFEKNDDNTENDQRWWGGGQFMRRMRTSGKKKNT